RVKNGRMNGEVGGFASFIDWTGYQNLNRKYGARRDVRGVHQGTGPCRGKGHGPAGGRGAVLVQDLRDDLRTRTVCRHCVVPAQEELALVTKRCDSCCLQWCGEREGVGVLHDRNYGRDYRGRRRWFRRGLDG